MANETTAVLEVTLNLDSDKVAELDSNGYSDDKIQKLIEKSITIKTDSVCPVMDIGEVSLRKYY